MSRVQHKDVHIVLGGTFDPVHFGHLRMAEEMLNAFPGATVSLMPSAYPPHRQEPSASVAQRIEMLQLVLTQHPQLALDTRELERDEPSYSVVTLQQIRAEIGSKCLIFLMGTDAFCKLDEWYQWQDLLSLSNLLVIGRPSSKMPTEGVVHSLYQTNKLNDLLKLSQFSAGRIGYYEMPQLDISSSYIREQIKCGKSPRFLLPDDILAYIQTHNLYPSQKRS